ncbi:nucleolar protein 58 isoform X4 [Bombus impatiens]|uniref:Nucleolar protein 58 n=1 Tax=Bombus impatiens TaxID=132113 RepID=A0A6P8LTS4_BOMIM|nr:nucleolar protein 58 isoform X4 [Bombus impatiens]
MLVLFETPAGYAIFKLLDEDKLTEVENLYHDFETPEAASKIVKLKHFEKFADTTEALVATTAAVEGKLCKSLKKILKKHCNELQEQLAVADAKLDDLDKELNNYVMRCREWYGWHFPELGKIITDNIAFVKTVKVIGTRENTINSDLSDILSEDVEGKVKEAAEISMGTEISEDDILNIQHLCDQVIEISQYRTQLYDYLKARMMAMAPNLTVLVGELVGARLISHAGSLINLAKHPASTVQILGAEKALFRALKSKKDTPKYGLIYHAQLVGQSSTKNKGKMSRMLAAKASLATRVDALGEDGSFDLGAEHKAKLEARLRILEEGNLRRISGTGKAKAKFEKYYTKSEYIQYSVNEDVTPRHGKRKHSEIEDKKALIEEITKPDEEITKPVEEITKLDEEMPKKKKKKVSDSIDESVTQEVAQSEEVLTKKKKKKSKVQDIEGNIESSFKCEEEGEKAIENIPGISGEQIKKKKKKKDKDQEIEETTFTNEETSEKVISEKRKKKKKKSQDE